MSKKAALLEQFIAQRIEGKSFQTIGTAIGVAKATLVEWNKECRTREAIDEGQLFRLNETVKAYSMDLQARLSSYLSLSQRLHDELAGRELKDVPTDKLLSMSIANDERVRKLLQDARVSSQVGNNPFMDSFESGQNGFFHLRADE